MASTETQKMKPTKYLSKKVVIDGIKFDSIRESKRYVQLKLMARAGLITGLTMQVPFVLVQPVRFEGATRAQASIRYYADFVYSDVELGKIVVEDVKSAMTQKLPVFVMKRHLMLAVHGINLKLTT